MSHVAAVGLHVKDLDALALACTELGLELVPGQTTFRWYGRFMDDTVPNPDYPPELWGTCAHAIRYPGASAQTYEIGVVPRANGEPGYELLFDSWDQATRPLAKAAGGVALTTLRNRYAKHAALRSPAMAALRRQGYRVTETTNAQGESQLVLQKG